jgi:transketolase
MKAATGAVKTMEETMRVLTQTELSRMTRTELMALLRRLSAALPDLREGSAELRDTHANLQNIRRALVKPPAPAPRP